LIFKKADTYDSEQVQRILGSVDLNNVPSISNYKVTGSLNENTRTLTLPAAQLEIQQAGGTWAELFNINSVINKYPVVGLIVWYLFISTLGWVVFPTTRIVFKGLKDRGYPFGRVFGMLVLAVLVWLAGSVRIPFAVSTILIMLAVIGLVNAILAALFWDDLKRDLIEIKDVLWQTEIISLALFLFPVDTIGEPGFVASVQGWRETDGFFILQCRFEKHHISAL